MGGAFHHYGLGQIHEAAALGIDGQSVAGQGRHSLAAGKVGGQGLGVEFRLAAAYIESVQRVPVLESIGVVVQQGQRDKVGSGRAQGVQIFLIVEPEGCIAHIADAGPEAVHRC